MKKLPSLQSGSVLMPSTQTAEHFVLVAVCSCVISNVSNLILLLKCIMEVQAGIVSVLFAAVQATNCRISGSDLIENLHLDQRFCLSFKVTLTWDAAESTAHNGSKRQAPQQYGMGHIQVSMMHTVSHPTAVFCSASAWRAGPPARHKA